MALSREMIRSLLTPYAGSISEEHSIKIVKYLDLLKIWNPKIGLTSVSADQEMARVHFGESLCGLPFFEATEGRVADLGSGAGFPGLVIALFRPNLQVALIESNKKKSAFLSEAIRSLGLKNACVLSVRYESARIEKGSLDYVTSRALGGLEGILNWSFAALSDSGKVVLWTTDEVVAGLAHDGRWRWQDALRIPGTRRRVVLAGSKYLRSS